MASTKAKLSRATYARHGAALICIYEPSLRLAPRRLSART